jgi:hypothetical protein
MSDKATVTHVLLIDRLIAVRQAVDDALRVLSEEADGTPPPSDCPPQPAESMGASIPVGCKHTWVLASFGGSGTVCQKCGDRGVQ